MPYTFKFPDIGEGIAEGKILEWYVEDGQQVSEGENVVKVETDKVVADIPIPRSGTILKRIGAVDETINVEDDLVVLLLEGESADGAEAAADSDSKSESAGEESFGVVGTIEVDSSGDVMPAGTEGRGETAVAAAAGAKVRATPAARALARDLGVDLNTLRGSGPAGRILKSDITAAAKSPAAAAPAAASAASAPVAAAAPAAPVISFELPPADGPRTREEALTTLRKTIASRMVASKSTAPHATTFEEVEVSRLVTLRAEQKERMAARGIKLSYMPFIFKAAAMALMAHPVLNCRLDLEGDKVVYHNYTNIGLAVDTPEGLVVPVIRDAERKTIAQLAVEIDDFARRSRERGLKIDELRGGTFSITNYGAIAGIHGCPIINVPEVAILGIGRLLDTPIVKDGAVVPGKVLPLSLSVDHRIVDGGDAARFQRTLIDLLSDPVQMLLG